MRNELNEKIWNLDTMGPEIKPNIRINLLKIANDFMESIKIKNLKIYDVVITGSMANYNWHSKSDIDLHIIFDLSKFKKHKEFIKQFLLSKKTIWNNKHDISIGGHNVEIYPEDKDEDHHSTGIYSLAKNKWLIKPEKGIVVADKEYIRKKYHDKVNQIFYIIEKYEKDDSKYVETLKEMEEFLTEIREDRKSGLSINGEYAVENLVYKMLRNNGHLQRLYDLKNEIYDKSVSLENKNRG